MIQGFQISNVGILNTNNRFVNVASQGEEYCTIKVSFGVKAQKLYLGFEPDLIANGTISKQTYHMSNVTMGATDQQLLKKALLEVLKLILELGKMFKIELSKNYIIYMQTSLANNTNKSGTEIANSLNQRLVR